MNRWMAVGALMLACVLTVGCSKSGSDEDAIRASIDKRLNSRSDLNMGVMDREVKKISVDGNHATAEVEFHVKGGDATMTIEYALERQGKDWVVLSGQPLGMNPDQSGAGQTRPGQMPPGESQPGEQQMPQGHPPVN